MYNELIITNIGEMCTQFKLSVYHMVPSSIENLTAFTLYNTLEE